MASPNKIPAPKSPQMAGCQQEPCSALPVPRDSGGNGWKTRVSLCESIVKKVTYNSGVKLYAETVDDVIQELESRGYLKYEQNADVVARREDAPPAE